MFKNKLLAVFVLIGMFSSPVFAFVPEDSKLEVSSAEQSVLLNENSDNSVIKGIEDAQIDERILPPIKLPPIKVPPKQEQNLNSCSNYQYITQWGTLGSGNGEFNVPKGVTVDSLGYVYVADTNNHRIQKFGCATVQTPSITVTYPNGGEVFTAGQQITITWTSQNIPSNAQVGLVFDHDPSASLQYSFSVISTYPNYTTVNDGSETITIPSSGYFGSPLNQTIQYGGLYSARVIYIDPNSTVVSDSSDNLFTINQPSSNLCTINSFTVPTSTTIASRLSVTFSWSSNCNNVVLQANSGSYTLRHVGGSSGTHTFTAPPETSFSIKDSSVDITLIAGNNDDTISQTRSVQVTDVTSPAPNQCVISSLTATPNPVLSVSNQTSLSWVAPAGCIVYVQSWTPSATGLTSGNIFKPGTYYFNATDSVTTTLSKSTTYYISAQAGADNKSVLSAKTIDVKKN